MSAAVAPLAIRRATAVTPAPLPSGTGLILPVPFPG
jgi:hypothetical protein